MLESEAQGKWCWRSVHADAPRLCATINCIAWEVQTVPEYEEVPHVDGDGTWKKHVGRKPKDPPEGCCSALPPEPNCNYG